MSLEDCLFVGGKSKYGENVAKDLDFGIEWRFPGLGLGRI